MTVPFRQHAAKINLLQLGIGFGAGHKDLQQESVRATLLTIVLLGVAAVFFSPAVAAPQLAVPIEIRNVNRSASLHGRLVRLSGYVEKVGKDVVLREHTTGHKIDLDFSASTVSLESLMRPQGPSPAEVTGRLSVATNNGRPMVSVIGAIPLKL